MKHILSFSILFFFNLVGTSSNAQSLDYTWLKKINSTYTTSGGNFMKFISDSDTPIAFIMPSISTSYGLVTHKNKITINGLEGISSQLVNATLTLGLKTLINRPRPFVTYPDIQKHSVAGSKSFPSGHTSTAFAAATSLALSYPKWYVIAPAYLWASSVGYSRMYLGVHYPSDVFIGALVGSGSACLVYYGSKYIQKRIAAKRNKAKI